MAVRMEGFDILTWPLTRLGEALRLMGEKSGLSQSPGEVPLAPKGIGDNEDAISGWIEELAQWTGMEAAPVEVSYGDVETFLLRSAPALIRLPGDLPPSFIAIMGQKRGKALLLGKDGGVYPIDTARIRKMLCRPLEGNLAPQIETLLQRAGIPEKKEERIKQALLARHLSPVLLKGYWLLRLAPSRGFYKTLLQARVIFPFLTFLLVHTVQYLLWILSWWVIGKGALEGHLHPEWILGWGLLLLSLVPLKTIVIWAEGRLAINIGGVFKQRLLYGAMRIQPDEIRHLGAGALLGRVFESEALESLALSGGFMGILALVEILISFGVLMMGAAVWLHTLLLIGWIGIFMAILIRYWKAQMLWTEDRVRMTNDLVEKMTGHRTRLAQEIKEHWHQGEDEALEGYLRHSKRLDQYSLLITSLIPRGWMVLGLIGLAPAFVRGVSAAYLAVSLGGVLLIYKALQSLSISLVQVIGASIAWKYVSPFLQAAGRPEETGTPTWGKFPETPSEKAPFLVSRHLFFQYPNRRDPVIQDGDLSIYWRDRILLEGPSGCGKSTLSAILSNLRDPDGGTILLHGLDRHILGRKNWRRYVCVAPQFHENHVFTETFAFNLLMGHRWPPRPEDLQEAEAICHELGLRELLSRMPAGMLQMVGETGWQLSHGEKSRLYMARALLQKADLIILDETFAALDPRTLEQCLQCVLRRANTLLVITHQ
ncbi:MAG: ATP-binding cassette domain-containing protein [bacterium]